MSTYFFSDTSVMLGRSLRHVTRSVDTIVTVTIMPIAFMLLFVYVFGGAIRAGTGHYVNYLVPGILLIAIASGISYTAYRLFNDLQSGIHSSWASARRPGCWRGWRWPAFSCCSRSR
jgi:ABC-2 type transport system permease protein